MKIAYMFSGQGAQYINMGLELYQNVDSVKEVYDICDEVLDFKITDICFKENSKINNTMYTQPALLATSIAFSKALEKTQKPEYVLGLSLGEYSALTYSGVFDLKTAIELVHKRGRFMNEAVENLPETSMYAIIGLEEDKIVEIINRVKSDSVIEISNYNTKGQIVIAGYKDTIELCLPYIKEVKGKAIELNVSGPFHTSLLESASIKLNEQLKKVQISDSQYKVISNLTATEIASKDEVVDILTKQVKSSVKWQQSIEYLLSQGVDTFIEIGPSKTLSNFVKKIDRSVTILNVEDLESLNKTIEHLKNN